MDPSLLVPLALPIAPDWNVWNRWNLGTIARLRPGVNIEQAKVRLSFVNQNVEKSYPAAAQAQLAGAEPTSGSLHDALGGNTRGGLLVLMTARWRRPRACLSH